MTLSRRGFLAALLAVPLAASRAMSNVVHGRPSVLAAVNEGLNSEWDGAVRGTGIVRELWIELDAPHGVCYSVNGGPLVKTAYPQLPMVPLKIDLPPWVQDKMPTVTFKAAGDEAFRVYGACIHTPLGDAPVPERTIYIGGRQEIA